MSQATASAHNALCKAVLEYCTMRQIAAWKVGASPVPLPNGGFRPAPTRGISDIIGVLPTGRFLAAEVKTGTGRLSPEQKEFLDRVRMNGGLALVVRDITQFINDINETQEVD